ncbi:hypothetical protein L6261_00250 [Candidatus Parcubacteria bacterium]|nr:hypothetical protein [Candidatus Parcubacteria bacterium]
MRKFVLQLSALFLFTALFSGVSFATDWHDLSQITRNHLIHDEAISEVGTYGGECKQWARDVVYSASGGVVTIPSTTDDGYGDEWEYSPDVGEMTNGIEDLYVHVGMIVQMRIRYADNSYGPHTAIIYQKGSSGITWVESNFYNYDGMVTNTRYQTYAQFYSSLEDSGSYSIYYIK